jgi:20S proteasome alpha/beta subunit
MMNIFLDSAISNRYDKSISLFSPDGDLLQIKYADKAGANGLSLVCIVTAANSIVLCSPSLPSHGLMDRRCIDKVSKVDEGIWVAFAGLLGDGRYIIRKARQFCNSYQMKFGCRPDVAALAQHIGSLQHEASVKGGKIKPHMLIFFNRRISKALPAELITIFQDQDH